MAKCAKKTAKKATKKTSGKKSKKKWEGKKENWDGEVKEQIIEKNQQWVNEKLNKERTDWSFKMYSFYCLSK